GGAGREKNGGKRLLESAAVKLSPVVPALRGATGRDIRAPLTAGKPTPRVRPQLARARARRKIAELEAALEGAEFFTAEHAALLATMLGRIDHLNAGIARLTAVTERLLAPYQAPQPQAASAPAWGGRPA